MTKNIREFPDPFQLENAGREREWREKMDEIIGKETDSFRELLQLQERQKGHLPMTTEETNRLWELKTTFRAALDEAKKVEAEGRKDFSLAKQLWVAANPVESERAMTNEARMSVVLDSRKHWPEIFGET